MSLIAALIVINIRALNLLKHVQIILASAGFIRLSGEAGCECFTIHTTVHMQARMDHKLVTASAANKESVSAAIDGIQAKGTTNLSAGLFMGLMQQIKNGAEPTPGTAQRMAMRCTCFAAKIRWFWYFWC